MMGSLVCQTPLVRTLCLATPSHIIHTAQHTRNEKANCSILNAKGESISHNFVQKITTVERYKSRLSPNIWA